MTGVLHHVGMTVPDLAQAVEFFTTVLGCHHLFTPPPGAPMSPDAARHLNLSGGETCTGIAMLRAGGCFIELFQYDAPGQRRDWPRSSDIGCAHLAFAVDNIATARARVEAAGGTFCADPVQARSPGFEGLVWAYFVTPWGQTLELVETASAPQLGLGPPSGQARGSMG